MIEKSDAEFIAECEEHNQEMLDRWFCGSGYEKFLKSDVGLDFAITRAEFAEAIERLKRAQTLRTVEVAKARIDGTIKRHDVICAAESREAYLVQEIAELKSLLRWCHQQLNLAKCVTGKHAEAFLLEKLWDSIPQSFENEKTRIEELIKETK